MIISSHSVFLMTKLGGLHNLVSEISLACLLWYFRWYFFIACLFFVRSIGLNSCKLDKLMKKINIFISDVHKTSLLTMHNFLSVIENATKPISQIQDELLKKKVSIVFTLFISCHLSLFTIIAC